jgi:threonine/homoserine/homoserine lactone efflux protein
MLVVVGVCTLAAQALPEPRPRQPQTAAAVIGLTAGVALIVLGVRAWLRREQAAEDVPAWTKSIDMLNSVRALGLGLLLDIRPKNVLLAAAVGVQLHVETLDLGATIAAVVLYVVIATSSLTIPIVLTSSIPTGCNLVWKPWRRD